MSATGKHRKHLESSFPDWGRGGGACTHTRSARSRGVGAVPGAQSRHEASGAPPEPHKLQGLAVKGRCPTKKRSFPTLLERENVEIERLM